LTAQGWKNAVDNAFDVPATGGRDLPSGCHAIATESTKHKIFQCVVLRQNAPPQAFLKSRPLHGA
jgi:hypothetical protein